MTPLPELLLRRFEARFEARLTELVSFARAGDAERLSLAFHSLAGIGGTYGYPEITRVAQEAEERCTASDLRQVWRAIRELKRIRDRWTAAAVSPATPDARTPRRSIRWRRRTRRA